jgi:hypothetical protein
LHIALAHNNKRERHRSSSLIVLRRVIGALYLVAPVSRSSQRQRVMHHLPQEHRHGRGGVAHRRDIHDRADAVCLQRVHARAHQLAGPVAELVLPRQVDVVDQRAAVQQNSLARRGRQRLGQRDARHGEIAGSSTTSSTLPTLISARSALPLSQVTQAHADKCPVHSRPSRSMRRRYTWPGAPPRRGSARREVRLVAVAGGAANRPAGGRRPPSQTPPRRGMRGGGGAEVTVMGVCCCCRCVCCCCC